MTSNFWKGALAAGVPFAIGMGVYLCIRYGLQVGVPAGILSGVLFGGIMSAVAEKQRKRMGSPDGLFEGKKVIYEGPANHFRNGEGRGGWLTLTEDALHFRSHGKNLQNQPVDIELSEVSEMRLSRTLGIVPNGFQVFGNGGEIEKFVLNGREDWTSLITGKLKK